MIVDLHCCCDAGRRSIVDDSWVSTAVLALLCCARPLTSRQNPAPWAWRNGDVGQGQSALPAKRRFPRWRALFPRWHSPPIGPDAPCCSSKQTEYAGVFVCSFYLGRRVEWSGASDSLSLFGAGVCSVLFVYFYHLLLACLSVGILDQVASFSLKTSGLKSFTFFCLLVFSRNGNFVKS